MKGNPNGTMGPGTMGPMGPWDQWDHGTRDQGPWDHGTRDRDQGPWDQGPGPGTGTGTMGPGTTVGQVPQRAECRGAGPAKAG